MANQQIRRPPEVSSPSTPASKRYHELLTKEAYVDSSAAATHGSTCRSTGTSTSTCAAKRLLQKQARYDPGHLGKTSSLSAPSPATFLGTQAYPSMKRGCAGVQHIKRRGGLHRGHPQKKEGDRLGIYRIYPRRRGHQKTAAFWEERNFGAARREQPSRETMDDFELIDKMQEQIVFLRFMFDVPEGRVIADYQKINRHGLQRAHQRVQVPHRGAGRAVERGDARQASATTRARCRARARGASSPSRTTTPTRPLRLAEECDGRPRQRAARGRASLPQGPGETLRHLPGGRAGVLVRALCLFIGSNGRGISRAASTSTCTAPTSPQAGGHPHRRGSAGAYGALAREVHQIDRLHRCSPRVYLGGSICRT